MMAWPVTGCQRRSACPCASCAPDGTARRLSLRPRLPETLLFGLMFTQLIWYAALKP